MNKVELFRKGLLVDGTGTPITCAKIEVCSRCGKEVLVTYGAYGWNGAKKLCYDCDSIEETVESDSIHDTYYGSDKYFEDGLEAFGDK